MQKKKEIIKKYFNRLSFIEETHKYFVDGKPIKLSVSGKCNQYLKPFDTDGISIGVARKEGKSQAEVLKEWKDISDEAIKIGNKTHIFGELYALDRTLKPSNGYEEAVVKFWKEMPEHIVPVMLEAQMYHKKFLFAGTSDILLYNKKTEKYIIADYKTNKDLFKNYKKQTMLAPFDNLLDQPINHYQLQLSYYQILIEQIPEIEVTNRFIVWIKPDGEYEMYLAKDYTKLLLKELENEDRRNYTKSSISL